MDPPDPTQRPTIDAGPHDGELSTAALPRRIGDYEVIEEIGRGGMGLVLKARQERLGRTVALKLIREGWLATDGARKRFAVEAEAAASLKHPNLGKVTLERAG